MANPVREVERIESEPAREPRALTTAERVALLKQLQAAALREPFPRGRR